MDHDDGIFSEAEVMNLSLADALQQLNLEPGTYRCELPKHEIVVQVRARKAPDATRSSEERSELTSADPVILDESCIMLDPWVELPRPKPIGRAVGRLAPPPPPDIPEIPIEVDEE
ncbi:MAG TPA: hypothetical protein VN688_15400 [Gemmataceae bacterium]|nr:hypothetical protein [Gemmataceae bacterium]